MGEGESKPIEQKNVPVRGPIGKEWQNGTKTITGQYPNRKERRAAKKKKNDTTPR